MERTKEDSICRNPSGTDRIFLAQRSNDRSRWEPSITERENGRGALMTLSHGMLPDRVFVPFCLIVIIKIKDATHKNCLTLTVYFKILE